MFISTIYDIFIIHNILSYKRDASTNTSCSNRDLKLVVTLLFRLGAIYYTSSVRNIAKNCKNIPFTPHKNIMN